MATCFETRYDHVVAALPRHLRAHCIAQDYDAYSAQDHASWRCLLGRLTDQLAGLAHPAYLPGIRAAGMSSKRLPRIGEMNQALAAIGWRAVIVDGFLPPAIFMEFQARRVLPISGEMRRAANLDYTPAPDIVHEAAGHAPMLACPEYASFLQRVGRIGARAKSSSVDARVYEATRRLSIAKESSAADPAEVALAEGELDRAVAAQTLSAASPATLVSRLHWWTVEYGLIGPDALIYGAGLLSSLGESRRVHDVEHRELSIDCIEVPYDITRMQPHLYVARDWQHLEGVLETLESIVESA